MTSLEKLFFVLSNVWLMLSVTNLVTGVWAVVAVLIAILLSGLGLALMWPKEELRDE